MWTITKFFEGYFFFGTSHPGIVSVVVAGVIVLFVGARSCSRCESSRSSYRQFRTYRGHMRVMRHEDTTLWFWQVFTGFALFFLASVHLYLMLTRPDRIGPFESADRVWSDYMWPLYMLLLLAVELHGGIGLYRLAVKWGWVGDADPNAMRRRLKIDQVVDHGVFPRARAGYARCVYQDRHRASGPLWRALRAGAWLATKPAPAELDERRLYRRARDRRRARRAAHGHRRQAPRPRRDHPVAGSAEALAFGGGPGRHAGLARQRHQGERATTRTCISRTRYAAATGAPTSAW